MADGEHDTEMQATELSTNTLTHFASGQPESVLPSFPVYITFSILTALPH